MSAYIILDVKVTDPARYEDYKKVSGTTLEKFGGRFVVRGGDYEVLEGDWNPNRIVVLEFENRQKAKDWYHSEDYREPKSIRHAASVGHMILVEGA
jgi:uncharacterized protein (DUF1330 family)